MHRWHLLRLRLGSPSDLTCWSAELRASQRMQFSIFPMRVSPAQQQRSSSISKQHLQTAAQESLAICIFELCEMCCKYAPVSKHGRNAPQKQLSINNDSDITSNASTSFDPPCEYTKQDAQRIIINLGVRFGASALRKVNLRKSRSSSSSSCNSRSSSSSSSKSNSSSSSSSFHTNATPRFQTYLCSFARSRNAIGLICRLSPSEQAHLSHDWAQLFRRAVVIMPSDCPLCVAARLRSDGTCSSEDCANYRPSRRGEDIAVISPCALAL